MARKPFRNYKSLFNNGLIQLCGKKLRFTGTAELLELCVCVGGGGGGELTSDSKWGGAENTFSQ